MNNSAEHFKSMLESSLYQYLSGETSYRLWRKITEAFKDFPSTTRKYYAFFDCTAEAHWEYFVNSLCRLIDTSGQSLNVKKILKYSNDHPGIFILKDKTQLTNSINNDLKSLDDEKHLIDKILKQRNKYYAHLSKEYLNSFHRQVFKDFDVPPEKMYKLLKKFGDILNNLNKNFKKTELIPGTFSPSQVECEVELSKLLQKLEKN